MDEHAQSSAIAVIGVAGRFPGALDLATFWHNLRDGVDSIRTLTDAELLAAGEDPAALRDPAYVRACPVLDGFDTFDAAFFGWSPRDAAITDPQHRVFLELAWEAFEDAGAFAAAHAGPVGVFASCGMNSYMMYHLVTNREVMETAGEWLVRHTGNDMNFLATRVSYELDLRGPSITVQTACSSTLVAIHAACQSLLGGECDMALAGGCTILLPHGRGYVYREGEILSPDGRCRPFDARAAGTVLGSGGGCVVLRRLADALAGGDHIHAVIRGSAVNNDGSQKVGYLAPSVEGQAAAVAEALALTGVSPETIGYVEAHGTATEIGDPIEVAALTQAYRARTEKKGFCALGSLKSNVGHLGEAAGVAGFLKVVLALENRQIPPSLHHERPGPHIDFANSPFFVATRLTEWKPAGEAPRRAGVTALGAGGTNVHAILEEAPPAVPSGPSRDFQLLLLSAKTPSALDAATANLAEHLRENPALPLADVAFTLQTGRRAMFCRRALVCRTDEAGAAAEVLSACDPARVLTQTTPPGEPSVVLLFPGGGAQYAGMGAELYASEPIYRETLDACLAPALRDGGGDLRELLFPPPGGAAAATRRLERPSLALPALFATEYALAKLLLSWGITPAAMIGHSMGEYVAACLAGVISPRDGMALVALRGRLFETLPEGGMLGVPLPEAEARAYMGGDLSIAAINGPSLCVASGPVRAIAEMEAALSAAGVDTTRVHIDVAAHSRMLDPILAEFERFCGTIELSPPRIPYVSNLTGTWITPAEATDPTYWARHLRHTVRFADGLATLLADPGAARVLLEVGPGRTLSSLAQRQPKKPRAAISTVRHARAEGSDMAFLLTALGRLWLAGVRPDWALFHKGEARRRVPLPTYPFERRRHWIEAPRALGGGLSLGGLSRETSGAAKGGELRRRPDITDWFHLPSWRRTLPPAPAQAAIEGPWLLFTDTCGLGVSLARRLPDAIRVSAGERFARIEESAYSVRPDSRADLEALWRDLQGRGRAPSRIVHLWAVTDGASVPFERARALHFESLLLLGQVLSQEEQPTLLAIVSNHLHDVAGEEDIAPEKALLLGPCRVIPREMPHVRARSIDVVLPQAGSFREARLHDQLLAELTGGLAEGDVVAYRGQDRWAQVLEPVRVPAPARRDRIREGGVYLITGGLGGIGLEIAEHLAKVGRGAKLVLIGRTPLPPREQWPSLLAGGDPSGAASRKVRRIQAIEGLGAQVVIESADVRSLPQVEAVVARARDRFGAVHGVVHAAGMIDDGLIALKTPESARAVLGAKVLGALALDAALRGQEMDFFVLFSSVSSILGLQGQVDYTAANAFLDAFARARSRREPSRTVAVNWGAWRDVGMALALSAQQRPAAAPVGPARETAHPLLERHFASKTEDVFVTTFARDRQWLLGEHVIRGAEALIPGTGHLEIARAALEESCPGGARGRTVEIREVVFLAPFAVKAGEAREMCVTLHRATSELTITSSGAGGHAQPVVHVTAKVAHTDMPPPRRVDLEEIRGRCRAREEVRGGFLEQDFLDFGPRWANLRAIGRGAGEALVELELPAEYAMDLETYRLHPALLDMATGSAQGLIPGFDRRKDFYVPFSYGRVLLRGGLPRRLWSFVRLGEASRGTASFHVTLLDEDGVEVAVITDFVMRRVSDRAVMTGPGEQVAPQHAAASALAVIREGMSAAEGVDVFDRVLASGAGSQIVASSIDPGEWMAHAAAAARPSGGEEAGEEAGEEVGKQAAPRAARPGLSTPFVAPRDELERSIAEIWQKMLGIEEVGVHDDFFEAGGHSLLLTQTVTRVRKAAGVDLPLRSLFARPTISEIAAEIRRAREGAGPAPGPAMKAVPRDAYRVKRSAVSDSPAPKKP